MKTIDTLFDTEVAKEKRNRSPESKLKSAIRSFIQKQGVYHFKIVFNRVYFGKVNTFPSGINKEKWLLIVRGIAEEIYGNSICLPDKKKANQ